MRLSPTMTKAIKTVFGRAGLRVERDFVVREPIKHFVYKAKELEVGTVLDVGANAGQFGRELREAGYHGQIVSFEPLASAHAACVRTAANDLAWQVMPAMALGNESGTAQINVSQNLVSSSLRPIKTASVDAAPASAFMSVETIRVEKLDLVASADWCRPLALKADTQGFEVEVLRGASETLADVVLLQLEMSLVELYEGTPDFCAVFQEVTNLGFRCIGLTQGFHDHDREELLQVDGLFAR